MQVQEVLLQAPSPSTAKVHWWQMEIGREEREGLLSAFDRKCFTLGEVTEAFEVKLASLLKVPYVVLTPSGTAAITMALMAAGVVAGDEVIVPDIGWIATAQAALILGARVVLVDCLPDTPVADSHRVIQKITRRTKAVILVHYNGRACGMSDVLKAARRRGVFVIEDCCKALLSTDSRGVYLGTIGELGCFSLGAVSLISIGYGGFVVTRDKALYRKLSLIRNHGAPRFGKEDYEETYLSMGFNFRVSDLLASIGTAQLPKLNERLRHVRQVYERYVRGCESLKEIRIVPVDVGSGQVPILVDARSRRRKEMATFFKQEGIELLEFHKPFHTAPYLKGQGYFPNASKLSSECFNLPCGPAQPLGNVERCVELLRRWDSIERTL